MIDDDLETSETAALTAAELTQAAAETQDREGRLWRLQWAQAFRRLSELGRREFGGGQAD